MSGHSIPQPNPDTLFYTKVADWSAVGHLLQNHYRVPCHGPHFHAVQDDTQHSHGTFTTLEHVRDYIRAFAVHGPYTILYAIERCRYCPQ